MAITIDFNDIISADFESTNSEFLSITDAAQSGLELTGDLSFSLWVKFESISTNQPLIYKFETTGDQRSYALNWNQSAGTLVWSVSSDGTAGNTSSQSVSWSPSIDTWYHLVVVFDANAGDVWFYVDGSLQGTKQTGGKTTTFDGTGSFLIGKDGDSGSAYFDGLIDEVGAWSKELSTDEISDLYNSGTRLGYTLDVATHSTLPTNLVSYWEMSESSGTRSDSKASNDLTDNNTVGFVNEGSSQMPAVTVSMPTPTLTNGGTIYPSAASMTISTPTPTVSSASSGVTNKTKSSAPTVTNKSKS